MNIVAFAGSRWQFVLVAYVILALLGLGTFLAIPKAVDPHFPASIVVTTIVLPGADALEMEQAVARPAEAAIRGLDHIRNIITTNRVGVTVVTVYFDHGTDADEQLDRVVRVIEQARSVLPPNVQRIDFRRPRNTEAAIIQLALVSETASWLRLTKYARDIREQFEAVKGVRQVSVDGAPVPQIHVNIDNAALVRRKITASQIVTAIQQNTADVSPGSVNSTTRQLNIGAGGPPRSVEEVEKIAVRQIAGASIRVSDLAKIDWGTEERRYITKFDGARALFITVKQNDNIDTRSLLNSLNDLISDQKLVLPPDIQLKIGFDQGSEITSRLERLALDFVIALLLIGLTVSVLGFRSAIGVMLSVPLALAIGMIGIWLLGYTLNQVTIAGFIIALGLLIDDSIVVAESISRRSRFGAPSELAAVVSTNSISRAVTSATVVLILGFAPIALLPELSGDFIRSLPVTVMVTLAASWLVSLTAIPVFLSRFLGPDERETRALRLLKAWVERFYAPSLKWALHRPRLCFWGALAICTATMGLLPLLGGNLFPPANTPRAIVKIIAPEGSSISETERIVGTVSHIIAQEPLVTHRMENIGRSNPQIFYNIIPTEDRSNYGEIYVTLKRWEAEEGNAMVSRLRKKFAEFEAARVQVVDFQNGPPVEAPVAIRLSGPDLAVLDRYSKKLTALMQSTPGTRDVESSFGSEVLGIRLEIDQGKLQSADVAVGDVRRAIRLAIDGEVAGQLRDIEGDYFPIVVRHAFGKYPAVENLAQIYVPTQSGTSVPLGQVANARLESSPTTVNHYDQRRSVTVTAFLRDGAVASKVNDLVVAALPRLGLPPGYHADVGGEAEAAARDFKGVGWILFFAGLIIAAALLLSAGNFRSMLAIISIVPLGTFGGIVALIVTGNSLSFMATIGFIGLIGIELKNSILLVDQVQHLQSQGLPLRSAIEKSGEERFLPVLLTSLTAICCLIPLALSGVPLYTALAWVMIGGLVSSTFLSRIVTPAACMVLMREQVGKTAQKI